MSVSLEMRAFGMTLDQAKLRRAIQRGTGSALPKIGAFVRKRARQKELRRRKRVSVPGERPSVHSTDSVATLKNIQFAVDDAGNVVRTGPIKLNQANDVVDVGRQTVPQILEFGGTVGIKEESRADGKPWLTGYKWKRRDRRRGPSIERRYRTRYVTYVPRPFMGPALAAEIAAGTIPQTLSGVVTAGA